VLGKRAPLAGMFLAELIVRDFLMIDINFKEYNNVIVLSIKGEFYIESVEIAEKIWNDLVSKRPGVIGINCSAIKFIDSSAIGVLVKFLNNAMKLKIELIFYDLSETVSAVFKTAKLGNFFRIMNRSQFESEFLPGA
jgi:anti-anti-sigma factor